MEEEKVYLGLGSNLGDRISNIMRSLNSLNSHPLIQIKRLSSIYETEPWGEKEQPNFLNVVIELTTLFPPKELLKFIKIIEQQIGHNKTSRWGAREIDLDILFYGNRIIESPELQIPHPLLQNRAFVLVPLNELVPSLVHPVLKKTVSELLADLSPKEKQTILKVVWQSEQNLNLNGLLSGDWKKI